DAIKLFERAALLRPEDYQAPFFVGQAYYGLGQHEEGKAARRRAAQILEDHLALNPDDTRALIMGAGNLASLGEFDRAYEMANQAVAIDPDDSSLLYNAACTYS